MKNIHYGTIEGKSFGFLALLGFFGVMALGAFGASYYMEHHGHVVTGMNNQIVWGMPHVFAVFLIVAASGALNVASIASVFGRVTYKPMARLSALLALTLLIGGLCVLMLDLGRPDRLIVAMTKYNFKSIFALNVILYNGFFAIVGIYLWMMMERKMNRFTKQVGLAALVWRLALTTGTGLIFGLLVARQAYDAAIMAPMFIIMSFAFGLAIFILVLFASYSWTGRPLGDLVVNRLKNLLGVFVAAVLYFVLVYHLTNLYASEHHGIETFILINGDIYTKMFWIGQILIGGLIPLAILFSPISRSRFMVGLASMLVIIGGLAQMYVIIIGAQAFPLDIFPGMEISSSFGDGRIASYSSSTPEILLGLGGIGIAMVATVFALKILPFLANDLSDKAVDPHYQEPTEAKEPAPVAEASSA